MNRIYLTCRYHPTQSASFLLADRFDPDCLDVGYFPSKPRSIHGGDEYAKAMRKWFETHATCGGTLDHFTVSYQEQKDSDVSAAERTSVGCAVAKALTVVK